MRCSWRLPCWPRLRATANVAPGGSWSKSNDERRYRGRQVGLIGFDGEVEVATRPQHLPQARALAVERIPPVTTRPASATARKSAGATLNSASCLPSAVSSAVLTPCCVSAKPVSTS